MSRTVGRSILALFLRVIRWSAKLTGLELKEKTLASDMILLVYIAKRFAIPSP